MSYEIEIDRAQEVIKVNVSGLLTQDLRKEILLSVASQLRVSDWHKVLIDLRESEFNPDEPMAGALELANFMRTIGIRDHVKIAFLYADFEHHRKCFENVAQLDGFNLRYFRSRGEAAAWLA